MSIQQITQERKERLNASLRPWRKKLDSLRNGTGRDPKIAKHIKAQAQHTEMQIQKEFEKLHQFLRDEEKARTAALREEEEQKTQRMEERIKEEILFLSDRVREVEVDMCADISTFLQDYDFTLARAQSTLPDPELDPGVLIDVAKHLGNLRYRVWEKMKDISPYIPVILDPNTAHPLLTLSEDLTCASSTTNLRQRPDNPERFRGNLLVLGSEGFSGGYHSWDVQVGDGSDWTLGVILGTRKRDLPEPLTPGCGVWGICRRGDHFQALTSPVTPLELRWKPQSVRVKLGWHMVFTQDGSFTHRRKITFSDASSRFQIYTFKHVPSMGALFPFLCPGQRLSTLQVAPTDVTLRVRQEVSFFKKYEQVIFGGFFVFIAMIILFVLKHSKSIETD